MKVVLINPPPEGVKQKWDNPGFPPLGLGYIAASLLQEDIPVEVLDAKLEETDLDETADRLSQMEADIFGLSAMTHEINTVGKLAKCIKASHPKATVIVGGCHTIAMPEDTMTSYQDVDVVICGEGETAICEIVHALDNGGSLAGIRGIAYREGQEIILNEKRDKTEDLDSIPEPAWKIFPRTKIYPVMTSRGCPFRCVFCMRAMGDTVRFRSVEGVVDEVGTLINDFGVEDIYFYDETFTLKKKRIHRILDMMIERGYHRKMRWLAQTRVNKCDEELLTKMAKAGCFEINFGIESGNQEILKRVGKDFALDEARKVIPMVKKAGIEVANLFILGHPGETRETIMDTINFAVELNSDRVAFGIMVPYPGTEVARMAANGEGGYRLLSQNWSDYNKYLGNALEIEGISRKELERLQAWGYLKFYLWNFRFIDLAKILIRRWREGVASLKRITRVKMN